MTKQMLAPPGSVCKCVTKHIPKPMELHVHHIWPIGEGGQDVPGNTVVLCPTTHSNVHKLWRLYERRGGKPSWDELKKYSEFTRYVVEKGRDLRANANQPISTTTDNLFQSIETNPYYDGSLPNSA